jgi:KDO2-lipid IV(A) lauroyltransferase
VSSVHLPASRSKRPTLRHRTEYLAYRLVVGVLRQAPERPALLFGEGMGWFAGVCLRIRWRTVIEHLRRAFPEQNAAWRRSVARASFRHLGRESVATFRLGRMDASEIRERTEVIGFDAVREAFSEGKGSIVVSGHFGNWEVGGASIAAHGVPVDVIAQRQRNPLFDADLTANRERLGMRVIERGEAPKRVLGALRAGRAVGIVGDQNVRRGGVFVDFFGRPASTARGTALFALRTGSPLFLGISRRMPGFPQRYRVTFEAVDFTPCGDMDEDVLRLTEAHTRQLERHVRETPEQYFWQHRRWKTVRPEQDQGVDRPSQGDAGTDPPV